MQSSKIYITRDLIKLLWNIFTSNACLLHCHARSTISPVVFRSVFQRTIRWRCMPPNCCVDLQRIQRVPSRQDLPRICWISSIGLRQALHCPHAPLNLGLQRTWGKLRVFDLVPYPMSLQSVQLQIVGASRVPFAVKGGGHTANPGFSSTPGVHISMSRFSEVTYNATAQTAIIGSGLVWDDVYAVLDPLDVTVVGGRFSGVGVAGYSLGGGYSWKSNTLGLTVDNIAGYELVLPNGTLTTVTAITNPDLFFGLKGGLNNFGIVTRFTFKTYPQTQIWGGLITYTVPTMAAVNKAVADFSATVTDPKAQIFSAYNGVAGVPVVAQMLFYDAPVLPPGIFDEFLSIPFVTKGRRNTIPFVNRAPVPDQYHYWFKFWSARLAPLGGLAVSYNIEPFLPSAVPANDPATAFPGSRTAGVALCPTNFFFLWLPSTSDDIFHDAMHQSISQIKALATAQGVLGSSKYTNYAMYDTPLSDIYGQNVPRLQSIKKAVDPQNVMGLAGGFKF
ncbi:Bifunctional solanapyrone synthase [Mycena venus]|uniref:Bifunctional solanapyrone synthase n=1 Tax=Mycena venus TaxID=2733690 RepID=A0A8H7D811_9AGAR|nr:Bifunctional solanapyrone synthase [Mycena venus]